VLLGQYSMSPALARLASRPHTPVISGPHAAARVLRARMG
jgi:hypothetical protein